MGKQFTAEEDKEFEETTNTIAVQRHKSQDDCWVVLYGKVYDVTSFLPSHPGGGSIILRLAGTDATEQYDPIHPPGTLEENLPASALLGTVEDVSALRKPAPASEPPSDAQAEDKRPVSELLNIRELIEVGGKRIAKKTWAYYYSAADDLTTKHLNGDIYQSVLLRPRVFIDCTSCSLSTSILGHAVDTPIFVSPAAMARLAHPSGEAGIASACRRFNAAQMISNNASMTPEQILADAPDHQVFGWQMYVQTDRAKSERMLARMNALRPRMKFICLTLDAPVPGKREDDERASLIGATLAVTSATQEDGTSERKSGASGGIGKDLFHGTAADLTWRDTLPWIKKHTDLPLVLKGIQTHEDAAIAAAHAPMVRGIVLSNHGGRAADTAPPPLLVLLEIRKYCPWVFDRVEVYVDGGIHRGTDVVKALCLGARAVGLGRAPLFALGAGGPEGVERVFEILNGEMATAMRLLGVSRVQDLGPQHVNVSKLWAQMYDGPSGLTGDDSAVLAKL